VPTISIASKLFAKEFAKDYGPSSGLESFAAVEQLLQQYTRNGTCMSKFGQVGSSYYVSLCTSLMARAHELLPQTGAISRIIYSDLGTVKQLNFTQSGTIF